MSKRPHDVTVLGAGLAGSEAAWQLAQRGLQVRLVDMKPGRRTPAQVTDHCAELVCSNSLRSANPNNAVGLLKEEMRRLGSLIVDLALVHRVPAGDALAVDREAFGAAVTRALSEHPRIVRENAVVSQVPRAGGPVVVATGPLTEAALAADIAELVQAQRLYFYDAIAPIVAGDSIDRGVVFAASRYGKGDSDDYLNCPLDTQQYDLFYQALLAGECMPLHAFEAPKYFQGCLPVEVIAASGRDALRFGSMKPVGLTDPRTGRRAHAVVQLRREDRAGQAFNLVGFQTKLKYPDQKRVFRLIPGLEQAEFVRLGAIHRNTYLDAPNLLTDTMALRTLPHVHFAGQITGVEGYVESAAHGLVTGLRLARALQNAALATPPADTALGALWGHVLGHDRLPGRAHEPSNVTWAMFPPGPAGLRKQALKQHRVARARQSLGEWARAHALPLAPGTNLGTTEADATVPHACAPAGV